MLNPYQVLGLPPSASHDEIRSAYRKLAKQFHPDLNPGNKEAERRFKEISQAYELVGDPKAREKFDKGEAQAQEQASTRGPFYYQTQDGPRSRYRTYASESFDEDLLRNIFGDRNWRPSPGADRLYSLEVDFREAALGAERELGLPNGKTIRVTIPPGIHTGSRLRLPGQGDSGSQGGPPGDAYVEIRVKPSPIFRQEGENLLTRLAVPLATAILGGELKVPTLEGAAVVRVPPGTDSGRKLRLRSKGALNPGTGRRGDLFVEIELHLPRHHDPELEKALREWSLAQGTKRKESA